jgi:hypothetical protein
MWLINRFQASLIVFGNLHTETNYINETEVIGITANENYILVMAVPKCGYAPWIHLYVNRHFCVHR